MNVYVLFHKINKGWGQNTGSDFQCGIISVLSPGILSDRVRHVDINYIV